MTIARKMVWALRSNRRMMSAYERSLDGITDSGGSIAAASRIVPGTTRFHLYYSLFIYTRSALPLRYAKNFTYGRRPL